MTETNTEKKSARPKPVRDGSGIVAMGAILIVIAVLFSFLPTFMPIVLGVAGLAVVVGGMGTKILYVLKQTK